MIIIVDHYQVPQLQMPGGTCSFAGYTLHGTAITEEGECVVVDQIEARLVEFGGCVGLCNGKTDGIGETLAKRASGDLNAWRVLSFWMARCDAVNALSNEVV